MRIARTSIVLDLTFGDFGKGVTVSNLCREADQPLVVRFTGGQQAGHTVYYDGIKHIFSSFGSGTLQGVPSFFTADTMLYLPNLFFELDVLEDKGITPQLFVDPLAMITTHYDVAYNRVTERISEHGSCGLGIAATMDRNLHGPCKLHASDLGYGEITKRKMQAIYHYYMAKTSHDDDLQNAFLKEVYKEGERTLSIQERELPFEVANFHRTLAICDTHELIFEGAQGIMLDQDHGIHPNTTYGYTTSRNAWKYIELAEYKGTVHMYYGTRCYQTRHGNGWMSKTEPINLVNNEEEINVTNEWQKNFRTAELDFDLLHRAINIDTGYYGKNLIRQAMVLTCVDQRPMFQVSLFHQAMGRRELYVNDSHRTGNMYLYNSTVADRPRKELV